MKKTTHIYPNLKGPSFFVQKSFTQLPHFIIVALWGVSGYKAFIHIFINLVGAENRSRRTTP